MAGGRIPCWMTFSAQNKSLWGSILEHVPWEHQASCLWLALCHVPPPSCYLSSSSLCFCLSVPLAEWDSLCRAMPLGKAQGLLKGLMSESTNPSPWLFMGLTNTHHGLKQQRWWFLFLIVGQFLPWQSWRTLWSLQGIKVFQCFLLVGERLQPLRPLFQYIWPHCALDTWTCVGQKWKQERRGQGTTLEEWHSPRTST